MRTRERAFPTPMNASSTRLLDRLNIPLVAGVAACDLSEDPRVRKNLYSLLRSVVQYMSGAL